MKRWIAMLLLLSCLLTLLPTMSLSAGAADRVKGGKLIALTFDDGPCSYTKALLDGLAERDVKVTFFLLGQKAESYPNTVRRMFDEGHQVAQHTYTHAYLTKMKDGGIITELLRTDEVLTKCIGMQSSFLLRPPYGDYNNRVLAAINRPAIIWSVDPADWKNRDSAYVSNYIVSHAHDGAIVLCHDIHKTTIPAALDAIDKLKAEGYEFVTVNELFRRRNVTLKDGTAYNKCSPNGTDLGAASVPEVITAPIMGGVEVSLKTEGTEKIYYSTDGKDPIRSGKLYDGPFKLTKSTKIRAISAYQLNGDRSKELVTELSLEPKLAVEVKAADGHFVFENLTPDMKVYYTTDGSAPTDDAQIYAEPIACYDGTLKYRVVGNGVSSSVKTFYVSKRGNIFLDIPTTQWYFPYMDQAVSEGLFNGTAKYVMEPQTAMTRAMFVTTLYRMMEGKNFCTESFLLEFEDVESGAWYEPAVFWSAQNGIVNGYPSGNFCPNEVITREQMCAILDRLFALLGVKEEGAELTFDDTAKISPWALESVKRIVAAKIILGNEKNCFEPLKSATRAEVATVLIRVKEFLATIPTDPIEDETPTDPIEDETPTDPIEDETPNDPIEDETPTDPGEGDTPTDPDEGEEPGEPGILLPPDFF